MTFDPMSPEFLADANAVFREYRESVGAYRHEGVWPAPVVSILRHDDVKAGFRDFQTFSSYVPPEAREYELGDAISMAGEDPPAHTRIRGAVNRSFTARAMNEFEPTVRGIVERCFDDAIEQGEIDMVEGLAAKIASGVISKLMGVPDEDAGLMREWTRRQATFNGASFWLTGPDDPNIERYKRITAEIGEQMQEYFAALYDERARNPQDDLLSHIVESELERQEGIALAKMLILAGNDTTMNLMNNIALCLIDHPDQDRLVRAEPDRVPVAVEETLRYAPSIRWSPRAATRDCEVAGVPINKDEGVVFWIGSANRDPRAFTNPEAFDITRPTEQLVVSFGLGPHSCLGLFLARMEGRLFLEALVDRTVGMERTSDVMPPLPTPAFFGVSEQHIRLLAS
jgi:cytochrome P450